jgi:hypothetical protein
MEARDFIPNSTESSAAGASLLNGEIRRRSFRNKEEITRKESPYREERL